MGGEDSFREYDTYGNRTLKVLLNSLGSKTYRSAYHSTENNLLTGISDAATCTFGYDDLGRQTSRSNTASGTWAYVYDTLDNMLSATRTDTNPDLVTSYKYDGLRHRIERTDKNNVTTRFIFDGDTLVAEADTSGNIIVWYTPGICESRYVDGQWQTYYYVTDVQGTTKQLVDSLQRTTDEYSYNAWGEEFAHLRTGTSAPKNPLRYVGKSGYYTDDDTGLDLLGVRHYDPLIGRFII